MTKEPKLVRARQNPEWDSYDQEVARLAERVADQGGQGLVGSVDELAGDKSQSPLTSGGASDLEQATVRGEDGDKHLVDEL